MNRRQYLQTSIALSLLIHVGVSLFFLVTKKSSPATSEAVEVTIMDAPAKTPAQKSAQVQKSKANVNNRTKQIIEQAKTVNDEKPVKDAYLSQFNQRVERESRAREHGKYNNLPQVAKQGAKDGTDQQKKLMAKKVAAPAERSDVGSISIADLKPQFDWSKISGPKGKEKTKGRDAASAQTDDYIKDSDLGMQTLLNTREFKYYSYYNRIKQQLSHYWEPKIKEKVEGMFRRGRKIASSEDRITRLLIELDEKGILVGVKLLGESGISDLDDAAIEAFREAAPFPNPPAGIVESDGKVRIRWDFVLEA